MNILKKIRRILSLVLAICLLTGVLPSLAIADSTWKNRETPYGAKLKAGTVLYADEEMEREAWILKEDTLVRVTETRPKTAKVEFTVKKQPKSAWVDGELLQPVDLATPTDLDAVIVSQDVILNEVEESHEEQVPTDIQPEEAPIEAEPEQGDPSTRPDGLGQDDNLAGSEPAQPEATNPQPVISSEVEKSPSEQEPELGDLSTPLRSGRDDNEEGSEPTQPEESNLQNVILSEVEESNNEQIPTDNQPEEAPIVIEDPKPEIVEDPETEIIEEPETLGSLQEELPETELLPSDVMAVPEGLDESSETAPATVYALSGDGTMAASRYINPDLPASRNQNPYGTCWSFSTIGGLELDLIRDKAANTSLDLSEFFLIYYSGFTYANPKGGKDESYSDLGGILDAGGNVGNAAYYLSVLIGTTTEADNPYQDPANRIPSNIRNIAAQITGAYELDTHDRDLIKNMILAHGGVSASIKADIVQNARGDWTLYNTDTDINHAIILVGWDDNYAASNFRISPPGDGAWYARNSWGNNMSYFWISYYDAGLLACGGIAFDAQNTGMDNFVYTYAADAGHPSRGGGKDRAVVVQEYTVDAQEQITAVGVDVGTAGITISARVLVNGEEAGVTKSRKAAQKGIYRLPLVSPVLMTSRDTVAVEVTYTGNGQDQIWIPYQPTGVDTRKNDSNQTVTVRVRWADGGGYTLNGRHYDEDSTIRLYTKQKSSAGLVQSITLSRTSLSLKTGEYANLTATVAPSNATNKTLTWTSSSPEIAYMDGNGRVVGGTKAGTALITAMSSNGVYASCKVTVTWQEVAPRVLYISSDLFAAGTRSYTIPASKGLRKGTKLILKATSAPAYTSDYYNWTSSNTNVIGFGTGNRTEIEAFLNGSGNVRITLSSRNHPEVSTYVDLNVNLYVPATWMRISAGTLKLPTGETYQITAKLLPEDATNQTVTWTSSDPTVAKVDKTGLVTAVKDGNATITASAEGGSLTLTCDVTVIPRAKSVTLDTKTQTIRKGNSFVLNATVNPSDAWDRRVTWSSSDPSIATVNSSGRVTGVKEGTAVITVTTVDGGLTDTCTVTVQALYISSDLFDAGTKSFTIPADKGLKKGSKLILRASSDPAGTADSYTWNSSNVNVIGLGNSTRNEIEAFLNGSGNVRITLSNANHPEISTYVDLYVNLYVPATRIQINAGELTLQTGDTYQLTARIFPENVTDQTVTWTSSDPTVAKVNQTGRVTAVKCGIATITASTEDGSLTDTRTVTVQALYISSDLFAAGTKSYTIPSAKGLKKGSKLILRASSDPAGTADSYTWNSSNVNVIGLVNSSRNECEAVVNGKGNVRITLSNANHPEISTYVDLYVNLYVPATWMQISAGRLDLPAGSTYRITASLLPENATDKTVTWTSSDPAVATVDQTGLVTAVKGGIATITASAEGGSLTLTCDVIVPPPVASVTLDTKTKTLKEGDSFILNATVNPSEALNHRITWSSSDRSIAKVNSDGLVTGVKDGTAVITVTTVDGGLTDTCTVTVQTTDPIKAFVYRMYRICLLREPDEGGFNGWVSALRSGTATGSQLAYGFLNSDEMIGRRLSDGDFVERNYEAIMGRASDAGGKQGWKDALASGMSRKSVISGFVKSEEFTNICKSYGIVKGDYTSDEARDVNAGITGFVSRLYTKMLGRAYDPDGLNAWSAAILKAPTAATVLQVSLNGFMHSPEFVNKNLNDTELVKVLYRTFLDREADQGGLSAWVQALQQGNDRDTVAAGFANSPEFAAIMAKYGF